MITVGSWERMDILSFAATMTADRADPVAVAVNVSALLAWVELAAGEDDARVRLRALSQCRSACTNADRSGPRPWMDDPAEFLRRAGVLYAFATAGTDEEAS